MSPGRLESEEAQHAFVKGKTMVLFISNEQPLLEVFKIHIIIRSSH